MRYDERTVQTPKERNCRDGLPVPVQAGIVANCTFFLEEPANQRTWIIEVGAPLRRANFQAPTKNSRKRIVMEHQFCPNNRRRLLLHSSCGSTAARRAASSCAASWTPPSSTSTSARRTSGVSNRNL